MQILEIRKIKHKTFKYLVFNEDMDRSSTVVTGIQSLQWRKTKEQVILQFILQRYRKSQQLKRCHTLMKIWSQSRPTIVLTCNIIIERLQLFPYELGQTSHSDTHGIYALHYGTCVIYATTTQKSKRKRATLEQSHLKQKTHRFRKLLLMNTAIASAKHLDSLV